VDDAVRSGIISEEDLPRGPIAVLGTSRSQRINTVVNDLVGTSLGHPKVSMGAETIQALNQLREFLFETVYTSPAVTREADRARNVVEELFRYCCASPEEMPEQYQEDPRGEGAERRVVDYVAGMTDSFAIQMFGEVFMPRGL
jgi:dGTPase